MYNERAKFEFVASIRQSERLRFLVELSNQLERVNELASENPGYSIELAKDGRATVDIWHPGKAEVLWQQLREAQQRGLLHVTSPKEFSEWKQEKA